MFNDSGADHVPVGHSPDVMRWLDPTKLIRKQVRVNGVQKTNVTPVATLYFRVKFYVTDPSRLSTCSSHVLTKSETTNHELSAFIVGEKIVLSIKITVMLAFYDLFQFLNENPLKTDQNKLQISWKKFRFR